MAQPKAVQCVAWSPRGDVVAAGEERRVVLWDAATQEVRDRCDGINALILVVAWNPHPSSNVLAVGTEDPVWDPGNPPYPYATCPTLWLWYTTAIEDELHRNVLPLSTPAIGNLSCESLSWNPSGNRLITATWGRVCVWDTDQGELIYSVAPTEGFVSIVAGRPLMVGEPPSTSWYVAFSLQHANVSFNSGVSSIKLCRVLPPPTENPFHLGVGFLQSQQRTPCMAWNGAGTALAIGRDNEILIWNTIAGRLVHTVSDGTRRQQGLDWNPVTNVLASIDASGWVHLWDPETMTRLQTFGCSGLATLTSWSFHRRVSCVAWSPAGDVLTYGYAHGLEFRATCYTCETQFSLVRREGGVWMCEECRTRAERDRTMEIMGEETLNSRVLPEELRRWIANISVGWPGDARAHFNLLLC